MGLCHPADYSGHLLFFLKTARRARVEPVRLPDPDPPQEACTGAYSGQVLPGGRACLLTEDRRWP
ncbi:MAG: hypothetical protein ACLRWQ_18060 [Flavonifractor plautii]